MIFFCSSDKQCWFILSFFSLLRSFLSLSLFLFVYINNGTIANYIFSFFLWLQPQGRVPVKFARLVLLLFLFVFFEKYETIMAIATCYPCAKYLLLILNLFFWVRSSHLFSIELFVDLVKWFGIYSSWNLFSSSSRSSEYHSFIQF